MNELISSEKLMSPSAIVTGSISLTTRITCGLRQSKVSVNLPPVPRSQGSGNTNWTTVPASTPIAYA